MSDAFTKWIELIPLPNKSAEEVGKAIYEKLDMPELADGRVDHRQWEGITEIKSWTSYAKIMVSNTVTHRHIIPKQTPNARDKTGRFCHI